MRNCIAVYSCWTDGNDNSHLDYDHPTPLTEEGELPRMLQNFVDQKIKDHVLIFPGPTNPAIEKHLQKICSRFPLDVHVLTGEDIERIKKTLKSAGFPAEFDDVLNMKHYGRLRNMSVIYSIMKGMDNVIQIDDDELIEDPKYMEKALGDMGKDFNGKPIYGKSGYYIDAAGSKYYDGQVAVAFKTWPKDQLFNEAVKNEFVQAGNQRLVDCTVAFGGNMAVNRKLFLNVPYDQIALPRGEDDDYVWNAKHYGFAYVFDTELWVRHLPPKRGKRHWARPRQDIKRFKYLREKIKVLGVPESELGVFFGYFLRPDLEQKAVKASIDAAAFYMDKDRDEAMEFLNNAIVAVEPMRDAYRACAERQLRFMDAWRDVMFRVEGDWSR